MISSLKRLWRDRRGNTLAIAGAALPLVIGSAGLASDTIQWTLWKRQLQRASDSAAAAGVYAIASGKAVGTCSDINGATYANPVAYDLKKNNRVGIETSCTLTNPPTIGGYTADTNAVRVALSVQKSLSFSGLFLSTAPTIRATSTATIVPSGNYCVISLENQAVTGINATGSTDVDLGCGMITNSTSMTAAVATGSSDVTASPIAAVGGIPASTHWGTGTVLQPFTLAQDDPFASVNPTPVSNPGCNNDPSVKPSETVNLTPGCYKNLSIKGTANLAPGVYYIDGGDLDFNSGAVINGSSDGVVFVLSNSNAASNATIGTINMAGSARLNLVAPKSGPYKGLMIYQDRRATENNVVKINGNSGSLIEGAFYFPRADFTYQGNTGVNSNCMQIVVKRVSFTGNSSVNNTCPVNSGAGSFTGRKIRLVE
jgi:hypothetical protein